MALKKYFPDVRFGGNKVSPDEMDMIFEYQITYPSVSATHIGTAAAGTASEAKALTIANKLLDHPRNLLYSVQGTADCGGTWTVRGKNQFGQTITETVAMGTAAAGTPSAATAGTKIFSEVTSGTFTATSTTVGAAIGRVGVAIGTAAGSVGKFGLPVRVKSTSDVKSITWINNGTYTALNGGTVSGYVDTTNHAFQGSAIIAATDIYKVRILTSYNSERDNNLV